MNAQRLLIGTAALLPLPALAQGAVAPEYKWLTFLVFGIIIAMTMFVTYLAARRVKSASQFSQRLTKGCAPPGSPKWP